MDPYKKIELELHVQTWLGLCIHIVLQPESPHHSYHSEDSLRSAF